MSHRILSTRTALLLAAVLFCIISAACVCVLSILCVWRIVFYYYLTEFLTAVQALLYAYVCVFSFNQHRTHLRMGSILSQQKAMERKQ